MLGKKEPTDELVTVHLKKLVNLSDKLYNKDTLKGEAIDWQEFTKAFSSMVQVLPLHTVISLHFHQALEPLLKAVHQLWKSPKIQTLSPRCTSQIKNTMQCIYENSYECFLKKEKKDDKKEYAAIISQMIKQKIIVENESSQQTMLAKDSRTLVIRRLLDRLYDLAHIRSSTEGHKARGWLNEFIEKELLVEDPQCLLEQVVLNWIKQKTEIIQGEPKEYICCKIHFEHLANSNISGFSEAADQEFKDYRWPLQNQSIKFHLTKTIVGYLNTTGGIIYVGMKEDKNKMVESKGIKLTTVQKLHFLYFIHGDILSGVYPKEPQRTAYQQEMKSLQKEQNMLQLQGKLYQQEKHKYYDLDSKGRFKEQQDRIRKYPSINKLRHQFTRSKASGYEYRINKYITIDFLDVYEKESNLNVMGDREDRYYVIRIKIKVGDPKELYHIINKNNIPQTYLREDKSVKKKTIVEFYKQFENRLSGQTAKMRQNQKNDKHAYCRFQPFQNTQNKDKMQQEIKQEKK